MKQILVMQFNFKVIVMKMERERESKRKKHRKRKKEREKILPQRNAERRSMASISEIGRNPFPSFGHFLFFALLLLLVFSIDFSSTSSFFPPFFCGTALHRTRTRPPRDPALR